MAFIFALGGLGEAVLILAFDKHDLLCWTDLHHGKNAFLRRCTGRSILILIMHGAFAPCLYL